ncbi:hypothetical protein N431DRAFT_513531 [Stipitochalara longipes BDJ]|nr:hypothetical protein N431DRAFT_513531 [Stipitochalara longipes BDJ]
MEFKRKRGRPRKHEMRPYALFSSDLPTQKKRGRPKKVKVEAKENTTYTMEEQVINEEMPDVKMNVENAGEEDLNAGNDRNGNKKFDHLFVYGSNSIAVDPSELHKLIMKVIRKQKIHNENCCDSKTFIAGEQRAMDNCFFLIKYCHSFGLGEDFVEEMIQEHDKTAVVSLALEALEQVPKTWKNAHAIFATTVKVLEDMWEALERFGSEIIQDNCEAELKREEMFVLSRNWVKKWE